MKCDDPSLPPPRSFSSSSLPSLPLCTRTPQREGITARACMAFRQKAPVFDLSQLQTSWHCWYQAGSPSSLHLSTITPCLDTPPTVLQHHHTITYTIHIAILGQLVGCDTWTHTYHHYTRHCTILTPCTMVWFPSPCSVHSPATHLHTIPKTSCSAGSYDLFIYSMGGLYLGWCLELPCSVSTGTCMCAF